MDAGDLTEETFPNVAITGATGFIGKQLLADCLASGISVSALTRQSRPDRAGLRWVKGDLDDDAALAELVDGADHVIHLAGATKALRDDSFATINADATRSFAKICRDGGVSHFVFMSSLAATRPSVSPYAASKSMAESHLLGLGGDMRITTVRAPAVLGPGDAATQPLFSNLARRILPVPGGPARAYRFSIIDVIDLSKVILNIVRGRHRGDSPFAPFGHQHVGWQDIAESAERTLGRPIRRVVIPAPVLRLTASVSDAIAGMRGKPLVFSRSKLDEMNAGDWIANSQVDDPVPLDETMQRCLAPFQKRDERRTKTLPQEF